ncbi:hypothetical protein J6590_034086 [Homalodisca vitripennis]|nr:hypothetical protein J6590_034086 [Homalodisca vitripennis]
MSTHKRGLALTSNKITTALAVDRDKSMKTWSRKEDITIHINLPKKTLTKRLPVASGSLEAPMYSGVSGDLWSARAQPICGIPVSFTGRARPATSVPQDGLSPFRGRVSLQIPVSLYLTDKYPIRGRRSGENPAITVKLPTFSS